MAPLMVFENLKKQVKMTRPANLTKQTQLLGLGKKFFSACSLISDTVIKATVEPFVKTFVKSAEDYVIIEEAIPLKDYDAGSAPRADQIKTRATKLGATISDMLNKLKTALTTGPALEPKAIEAICGLCDDKNFLMSSFLFRTEYVRMDLDTFGRVFKNNEIKRKYMWCSYFLFKILLLEVMPGIPELAPGKTKLPVMLALRILASCLWWPYFDLLKKNVKIISNNDDILEADVKPEIRESETVDRNIKPARWKGKRSGDEIPAIRDVFDLDSLKVANESKFLETIGVRRPLYLDCHDRIHRRGLCRVLAYVREDQTNKTGERKTIAAEPED